jgi:O-antigen/teichoic acid export membrane protein
MRRSEIIKNVSSSWVSLGVNILIGIFLSPFILHRLGNLSYGAWVLVFSVTGYYGLFDLGIRSSVIRYVSTFTATNDVEGLSRLINTSIVVYTAIGALAMVVTVAVSAHVGALFRMPAYFIPTARVLFLIVGTSVSLGFTAGIFGGVLEGLGRFYVVNTEDTAC